MRKWIQTRGLIIAIAMSLATVVVGHAAVANADKENDPDVIAKGWTGKVSMGVVNSTGKTDDFAGTLNSDLERQWQLDSLIFQFRGLYASKNEQTTKIRDDGLGNSYEETDTSRSVDQSAQRLTGAWKHNLTHRWFFLSRASGARDVDQDLNAQVTTTFGPGIRVWEQPEDQYLDLAPGVGYRYEIYRGDTKDDLNAADVAFAYSYKNLIVQEKLTFKNGGEIRMPMNDVSNWIYRTNFELGVPIVDKFSLNLIYVVEYVNEPADNAQSVTTRLSAVLEYNF